MVLRGSAMKPRASLSEVSEALASARTFAAEQTDEMVSESVVLAEELRRVESGLSTSAENDALKKHIRVILEEYEHQHKELMDTRAKIAEQEAKLRNTVGQFVCGGMAGVVSRTTVAPVDRVKLILQTRFITKGDAQPTSIRAAYADILGKDGVRGLWRGNLTNCFRVFPHAAIQFISYEKYSAMVKEKLGDTLGTGKGARIGQRLIAGSLAGATAATITHPIDVVRIQLTAYSRAEVGSARDAIAQLSKQGIRNGFYKGYFPTLLSLTPFIAVNFSTFDSLKTWYYPEPGMETNKAIILLLGAAAGIVAQSICYPLDTVRRRMQLKDSGYTSIGNAFSTILRKEGPGGFYKGMAPNILKVVPNNAIRFTAYTALTAWMGVTPKKKG